ncbi:MAG: putative formate dehydrogenase-associated protein [Gemmatimonadetes bacterium]|nr:putative formate dehydrogenase-associated protein [Gemmatimonadota bacterium]
MKRLGYVAPSHTVAVLRLSRGVATGIDEMIAEETPVTIAFNGVSHAVMMATPADLDDFVVGFSLTEGLIQRADALTSVVTVRYDLGIEMQADTSVEVASDSKRRRLSGRTGCGICGKEDVIDVLRDLPKVSSSIQFTAAAIARAMTELGTRQPLNAETGAVHAAAWADVDGRVQVVREDVGRHNALDKLIGALARGGIDAHAGFIAMTSRGSFELVQKAAVAGVALLATVSAPTGLAVRVANDVGLTLAGFAREERVTLYTHPSRVTP